MPYPYSTPGALLTDIQTRIIENNARDISGQELQDVLKGLFDMSKPPVLLQELVAQLGAGGSVGGTNTGEVFPINTALEAVLRDILIKAVPPTYVSPAYSIASSIGTLDYESGSQISPNFTENFSQNDAGAATGTIFRKNGVQISTSLPYPDTNVQIVDGNTSYNATKSYGQGPVKNNNLGQPDPTGRINAGSINSNTITYVGKRRMFYGTPTTVPGNSAQVRALANSLLGPQAGSQVTINIPAGAVNVVFAYPASLPPVSSVKYQELSDSEVKSLFTESSISVLGNNSYLGVLYRVYAYTPVEPFPVGVTYKVTI